jgi:hypothetical protein
MARWKMDFGQDLYFNIISKVYSHRLIKQYALASHRTKKYTS